MFSSAEQVYPLGGVASTQTGFLHLVLDGSQPVLPYEGRVRRDVRS